jgi:indole-3-glycerol phosphate synthase
MSDYLEIAYKITKMRVRCIKSSKKRISFKKAIEQKNNEGYLALIAEYKRASPRGIIKLDMDPWEYFNKVRRYATGFSVLTEPIHFLGCNEIVAIASSLNKPILYKDFIIEKVQIDQAKEYGASAILIIYELSKFIGLEKITKLINYAKSLGLDVLLEINNENNAIHAREVFQDSVIYGINSRNLSSLELSFEKSLNILKILANKYLVIFESGINNENMARKIASTGANAILVGTALMKNPELAKTLSNIKIRT